MPLAYDTPIGFVGKFDGFNFSINNLSINLPLLNSIGLFSQVYTDTNYNDRVEIKNLTINVGSIIARSTVGALAGFLQAEINNVKVKGVTSQSLIRSEFDFGFVGGFSGTADNSKIINSQSDINVVANGGSTAGGLSGSSMQSEIINSRSSGNVSGINNIGGLLGISRNTIISNSFVANETSNVEIISTGTNVGGLIGDADDTTIDNSYFIGQINGVRYVGGIVGSYGTIQIYDTYSVALITRTSGTHNDFGYFVGFSGNPSASTFSNNFYNSDITIEFTGESINPITQPDGIYGRTTLNMKVVGTYTTWDFATIWRINPSKNSGYPELVWQD
jgi:hypothetical protein